MQSRNFMFNKIYFRIVQ